MANPTLDSIDFIPGANGQPGKAIGHSGTQNFTFPYTGPIPVMPADLAASEARIISAVMTKPAAADPTAALAALQASVAALPQTADQTASFAALKTALGAVLAAVLKLPDPTGALAAIQTTLAQHVTTAAALTSIDVAVTGLPAGADAGQLIYVPNPLYPNANPTFTVAGVAAASTPAVSVTA